MYIYIYIYVCVCVLLGGLAVYAGMENIQTAAVCRALSEALHNRFIMGKAGGSFDSSSIVVWPHTKSTNLLALKSSACENCIKP